MSYAALALGVWIGGIALLIHRTDALQVATTEGARRAAVARAPLPLDDWALEDERGRALHLSDFGPGPLLVNFIYTRCPTVCRAQGSLYAQLQARLRERPGAAVTLLSLSIDPRRDEPARLRDYRALHRGDDDNWHLARPRDAATLERMVAQTGLRVIDDGLGGFAHSEALHLLGGGELRAIIDWRDGERLARLP